MHSGTSTKNVYSVVSMYSMITLLSVQLSSPYSAQNLFGVICNFPILPHHLHSPCPTPCAVVAKALMWCTKHWQDHVGLFCFSGLRWEKKHKCCLGSGPLAGRWEAGLSLWIISVSAGLWCALTASDNFVILELHMLPQRVWIGSYGQDTNSTGDCNCYAWVCNFSRRKNKLLHLKLTVCMRCVHALAWEIYVPYIATLSHFNSPHCNILSYFSLQRRLSLFRLPWCMYSIFRWIYEWYVRKPFPFTKVFVFCPVSLSASTFFVVYIPVCHQVMGCVSGWMEHTKLDGQGCFIRSMKCSVIFCLLQAHTHVQYALQANTSAARFSLQPHAHLKTPQKSVPDLVDFGLIFFYRSK